MEAWKEQMQNHVDTAEKLSRFIDLTEGEAEAIASMKTKWGTTPYFASLMDPDDPNCPDRKSTRLNSSHYS